MCARTPGRHRLVANLTLAVCLMLGWGTVHAQEEAIGEGEVNTDRLKIRERPSKKAELLGELALGDKVEVLELVGNKAMREDVRSIQTEQGAQRVLIKGVVTEQAAHSKKLDELLQRVPVPRRRTGR